MVSATPQRYQRSVPDDPQLRQARLARVPRPAHAAGDRHGFARTLARSESWRAGARYVEMIEAASAQLGGAARRLLGFGADRRRAATTRRCAGRHAGARAAAAELLGDERVACRGGRRVELDSGDASGRSRRSSSPRSATAGSSRSTSAARRRADGPPVTPSSAPVLLGEDLRDLGAAVAVSVVDARGGSVAVEGETLHTVRLSMSERLVNVDDFAEAARERMDPGPSDISPAVPGTSARSARTSGLRALGASAARAGGRRQREQRDDRARHRSRCRSLVAPTAFQRLATPRASSQRRAARAAPGRSSCSRRCRTSRRPRTSPRPRRRAAVVPALRARPRLTQALVAGAAAAGFRGARADRRRAAARPARARRPQPVRAAGRARDGNLRRRQRCGARIRTRRCTRSSTPGSPGAIDWLRSSPRCRSWSRASCAPTTLARGRARRGGVVVSNHGGRQLDGVPRDDRRLPAVVDAVAGRGEVLSTAASGAAPTWSRRWRSARARCSRARRALGLAAGGEQGAAGSSSSCAEELELGLKLLGCPTPGDVTGAHVRRAHL